MGSKNLPRGRPQPRSAIWESGVKLRHLLLLNLVVSAWVAGAASVASAQPGEDGASARGRIVALAQPGEDGASAVLIKTAAERGLFVESGEPSAVWSPEQQEAMSGIVELFTRTQPSNFAQKVRFVLRRVEGDIAKGKFDSWHPEDRDLLLTGASLDMQSIGRSASLALTDEMCSLAVDDWHGRAHLYAAASRASTQALDDATFAHIAGLSSDGARRLAERAAGVVGQHVSVDWKGVAFASPGAMLKVAAAACETHGEEDDR